MPSGRPGVDTLGSWYPDWQDRMTLLTVVSEDALYPKQLSCDPKFIQCTVLTPVAQVPATARSFMGQLWVPKQTV